MGGYASVAGEVRDRRPALGIPLRAQHFLLIGSTLALALTGLPQRLDSFGPSEWLMEFAGIETLRTVHHGAGAVLIVAGFYHAASLSFGVMAGRWVAPLTMIPDARDYRDAFASLLYFVGLRQQRPALRTPTYFQKLDYWVLAWALLAMSLTGVIRLFPARMTGVLSGDIVAAALELHSDVALLAVVWVVVVHLAYVTLSPHHYSGDGSPAPAPADKRAENAARTGG